MLSETAYLSLGSNLGERAVHLQTGVESLRQQSRLHVLRTSSLYETEPQDLLRQPWFLNMAVAIDTNLNPHELLAVLQNIEREQGRQRPDTLRRGPRTLDIDILLFGSASIQAPDLTIPHERMRQRRFVLEPLLELNPHLTHPVTGESLAACLNLVKDQRLRMFVR